MSEFLRSAVVCLVVTACCAVSAAHAQGPAVGAIEGTASTQNGAVRLPGVVITIQDAAGSQVTQQVSDADGRFRIVNLQDGRYRIVASLEGFQGIEATVVVAAGRTSAIVLDMPIALTEHVEVVASAADPGAADTSGTAGTVKDKEAQEFTPGGGFQAALRLLASVIQVPGGLSIKGGRPNQASVQIGPGTLIDPSTGLVHLTLPADAIDSVSVLPNPYAVEFGRFSSGLVVIQTRRAGDKWRIRLNNLDPTFRTRRYEDYRPVGLATFAPRVELGGPLVKDRLFLEQTAQYRYTATEVPELPQDQLRIDRWFSTFTRLDGIVSPRHSFVATGGFFPSRSQYATLGTFVPPEATVNLHEHVGHGALTERGTWSDALFSESTIRVQHYRSLVEPQGPGPMELRPETTLGHFFNRQRRTTATYQWINTVSANREGPGGQHLLKFGLDLLHSRYTGFSANEPVLIERSNGTLARRLDFSGPIAQEVGATDVAVYVQDRIQPTSRWYVELGGRIDRDGVLERTNATPRAGVALLLDRSGNAVLHGGYGLFYERTPSVAGAFNQFETAIDRRFAPDGVTPLGRPAELVHVAAPDLHTSRSATWNVAYDHRLSNSWSLHAGFLDRRGSSELVVQPVQTPAGSELLLTSEGRSTYREGEVGIHFTHGPGVDLNATYVRSAARGDLNAFINFFGTVLAPVVGDNAYAPTGSDVPNRLLVRGRVTPTPKWLLVGIADWHNGFPYSVVNDMLDFVGPRNALRFPNTFRLDLGADRRIKLVKWQTWLGVRVNNALNTFLPSDVQANLASPAIGTFYNSPYRQFRLQLRFE